MTLEEFKSKAGPIIGFQTSLLYKILSGRFILTIAGAFCFYKITQALCQILINKSETIQVTDVMLLATNILLTLSNIFTFYFVKSALEKGKNGNGNEG